MIPLGGLGGAQEAFRRVELPSTVTNSNASGALGAAGRGKKCLLFAYDVIIICENFMLTVSPSNLKASIYFRGPSFRP